MIFMKKGLLIISIILLTLSCAKTDPITGEKIIIEPDPVKKARETAARGGGLFGEIGGQKSSGQTLNFGTSNVLWRATLKSLEEQIKISVQFLNNELRSDSIKVTAHKRICENVDKCSNLVVEQKFIDTVKDNIITVARSLKIEEAKKEKK
jgi:hypothetical protein